MTTKTNTCQDKKILVMSFGSDAGGIEKSLIEFLKFLIAEGHKVDLYLWRPPGIMFDKIPEEVNVVSAKLYPGAFSSNNSTTEIIWYGLFRMFSALNNPTIIFRRFPIINYDIAISYCQNGYSPHYIINKVNAGKKIIFYHHGSYDGQRLKKKIDYRYFCCYDNFITVSNAAKEMLYGHFPKLNHIQVINNLTDEAGIIRLSKINNPFNSDSRQINICTVGRVSPEKGQLLAINAAKRLKDFGLDFKWWFVGDGGDKDRCIELSKELDVADCCVFTGVKSNPYPYILNCDIYVQPSYVEADPVTIREALILESDIVATDIPAIREALCDGRYGRLCAIEPRDMAQSILSRLNKMPDNSKRAYQCPNDKIKKQLRQLLQ
jgi:glycosyltransferase involved in cell wall biosynthesis